MPVRAAVGGADTLLTHFCHAFKPSLRVALNSWSHRIFDARDTLSTLPNPETPYRRHMWKVGMREGRYGSLGTFSQRSVDSVSGQAESASDLGRWPPHLRTHLSICSVDTGSDVWTPGTLPSHALRSVPHVRPAGPDRLTPSTQACVGPQGR